MNSEPIVVSPNDITPGRPRRPSAVRRHQARPRWERARPQRAKAGPVNISLWVPTTLIFAILAPFACLLAPLLHLAPRHIIPSPARLIVSVGAVLLSLAGTVVDVDAPDCRVRLRLF